MSKKRIIINHTEVCCVILPEAVWYILASPVSMNVLSTLPFYTCVKIVSRKKSDMGLRMFQLLKDAVTEKTLNF